MYYNVGDVCIVNRKKLYSKSKKFLKGKEYEWSQHFLGVRVNSSGSSHFGNKIKISLKFNFLCSSKVFYDEPVNF
jgi:hypothetical protein